MEDSLITVVTVCYNCKTEIRKTIESVINQDYCNTEFIVVDGGSTDGTLEIIREYQLHIDRLITGPDKGVYDAMNKAIDMSTGDWIIFMNAGDTFVDSHVIAKVVEHIPHDEDVQVIYGDTIHRFPKGLLYQDCKQVGKDRPMTHQSVFSRTSVMKRYGFDTRFRIVADENFYHQVENNGGIIKYIPVAVSIYESCFGLSSAKLVPMLKERTEMLQLKRDFSWYVLYLKWACVDFVRKHFKNIDHSERIYNNKLKDPRMRIYNNE